MFLNANLSTENNVMPHMGYMGKWEALYFDYDQ